MSVIFMENLMNTVLKKQAGVSLLELIFIILIMLPLCCIAGSYLMYNLMSGDDRTLMVLSFIETTSKSNANQSIFKLDKYQIVSFQKDLIKDADCIRDSCLLTNPNVYPDSTLALIEYSPTFIDNNFSFSNLYLYTSYESNLDIYPKELFNNIKNFNSNLSGDKIDALLWIRYNMKSYYAKKSDIKRSIVKEECLSNKSDCLFVINYKK